MAKPSKPAISDNDTIYLSNGCEIRASVNSDGHIVLILKGKNGKTLDWLATVKFDENGEYDGQIF